LIHIFIYNGYSGSYSEMYPCTIENKSVCASYCIINYISECAVYLNEINLIIDRDRSYTNKLMISKSTMKFETERLIKDILE
jgi:hypothetical protein